MLLCMPGIYLKLLRIHGVLGKICESTRSRSMPVEREPLFRVWWHIAMEIDFEWIHADYWRWNSRQRLVAALTHSLIHSFLVSLGRSEKFPPSVLYLPRKTEREQAPHNQHTNNNTKQHQHKTTSTSIQHELNKH